MALPTARVAIRQALADYLRTNLISAWPSLIVSQDWPIPDVRMPKQALTVLVPQNGATVEYHQPVVWSCTATTTTYSYGRAEFPIQLDAWAQFPAVRDDLAAAVLPLLNRNVEETLGLATLANIHTAPGLVIPLPTYANVTAEYRFDPEPMLTETTSYAEVSDFRATWSGTVTVYLMQQETQPLMKDVTILMSMNGATAETLAYTYQGQVTADAPILYWRMGDAAGSTSARDIVATPHNGAVTGTPTFGSTGLIANGSATNDVNTSAAASAAGTFVKTTNNFGALLAFTVEWWIKPSGLTAGGNDIGQSAATFKVSQNADGSAAVSVGNTSFSVPGVFVVGRTNHCVLTFDGTNARFYLNGQLSSTNATAAPGALNSFGFAQTGPWQCSVQEIALYNKALSATRILSHYLMGSNGP